ncbi:hypothetical protein GQ43DRAFT_466345 [Delitschia confertaspora ATCC 74209]|uniref:Kinetochore protein mis14 n=1 Tax=Delitschia confertaspora ATCC 74209 TaxID=1513339 RepID=A0A9P4JHX5_9PLEO|nr:hypothetical protein GQ43DRAFT_466345 [Delitschia confertaspora ATCC 74209]
MDEHRKIELQSPGDLSHIENNIRRTARQKLDLHLPPVEGAKAGEEDELRRKVEERVDGFVHEVIKGVRQNVWVNGMDVPEDENNPDKMDVDVEEEFEPFNESLRTKLSTLHAKRDNLISQISSHRRKTPALAAANFQAHFLAQSTQLQQSHEAADERARTLSMEEKEALLAVEELKRAEDVRRTWERTVEGLARLKGGLTETRARVERGVGVVGFVEGRGGSAAILRLEIDF